jgi:hypothetical protein
MLVSCLSPSTPNSYSLVGPNSTLWALHEAAPASAWPTRAHAWPWWPPTANVAAAVRGLVTVVASADKFGDASGSGLLGAAREAVHPDGHDRLVPEQPLHSVDLLPQSPGFSCCRNASDSAAVSSSGWPAGRRDGLVPQCRQKLDTRPHDRQRPRRLDRQVTVDVGHPVDDEPLPRCAVQMPPDCAAVTPPPEPHERPPRSSLDIQVKVDQLIANQIPANRQRFLR